MIKNVSRDGMLGRAMLPLRRTLPGEPLHVRGMALRARQEPRPPGRPLVNQPILYLSHLLHIELPPDQRQGGKNPLIYGNMTVVF